MKSFLTYLLAVLLAAGTLFAQEKPRPDARRMEVVPPVEGKSTSKVGEENPALPKIDLPEFVITGVASIDVPNVEKLYADEAAPLRLVAPGRIVIGPRERATSALELRQKALAELLQTIGFSGRFQVSMGTYQTPGVELWIGQLTDHYRYLVDGHYEITKGFAPYTNRSRGGVGLEGGVKLSSGWSFFDQSDLSADGRFQSETYRFYGSKTPSLTRTVSLISANGAWRTSPDTPVNLLLGLGYRSFMFTDSSLEKKQNQFDAQLETRIPVGTTAIVAKGQFSSSSIRDSLIRNSPYLDASLGVSKVWWGPVFIQASVHFSYAEGDVGQRLSRVYPHGALGVRLFKGTTLMASYQGGVRQTTLAALIDGHPFLSSSVPVRHGNVKADILGVLESDWDDVWRTRFSARYQSIEEYPLYEDNAGRGIWNLFYGGTTTVTSYRSEVFAKFRSNGYFGLSIVVHTTQNSVTQGRIPYVSDFEVSTESSYGFSFGLTLSARLGFVDRRNVDLVSGARLPEYWLVNFKSEYEIFRSLKVFVNLHNASDRKYQQWLGYRALPFVVTGGLSYQW